MLKRAVFLTAGNALTSLLLLARNILVARLISVEDFGVAATFAITMALIEMMTQLGLDQMIIQDKKGEDPKMQAGLQAFQVIRGAIAGLILLAIAGPYAAFLKIPEVAWAYQLIALVPVIRGFFHFDIWRAQRGMSYLPFVASMGGGALLSLVSVFPLYWAFGDYRAMLYAILIQQVLILVISHLIASRPYRLAWDPELMRRALGFGWPLLINGALLFAIFNGEKLIVGRELGMAELALFAMAFTLTLTPTLVLTASAQSFFLPQLSREEDAGRFRHLYHTTVETSLLIGVALALGTALVGPPVIAVLLGEKYLPMLAYLIWLGVVQALRVAKQGIAVVSLSRAVTGNAMIANAPRVLAMPLAWWLVVEGAGVMTIIGVAIAAEIVGFAVAALLVRHRLDLPVEGLILPVALGALTLLLIAYDAWVYRPEGGLLAHLHWFQLVYVATAGAMVLAMTDLRRYWGSRFRGRSA